MALVAAAAIVASVMVGCEKEGDVKRVNIPSQIHVKVGQTYDLGSTQSWSSNKTFVASVNGNGVITGQHVGECTVSCADGSCRVIVQANVNLFEDPITQWGWNRAQVFSKAGSNYQQTSEGNYTYETGNGIAPYLVYTFTNGSLTSALLMVKTSYTNQVVDHLSERYKFMYKEGTSFIFLDGNSMTDATTMVILKYYNSTYWAVFYSEK